MVDKREVWKVCDKLRAAGRKVTYRAVAGALEEGGSFRDVGPLLRLWKDKRDYRPRLELADMPKEVRQEFEKFSVAAWKAVKARAGEDFGRALVGKAELDEEALNVIDRKDVEIASLRKELQAARDEAAAFRREAEASRRFADARGEQVRAQKSTSEALAKLLFLEQALKEHGIVIKPPGGEGAAKPGPFD